jgi:diguanylate cyclase (GGDEF)-like protein
MNDLLTYVGHSTNFGLNWPAWIATGGFGLFCLLGLYAAVLLFAGDRLPMWARFIQLPNLRSRMILGFVLAGTLPAISLALVMSERTTDGRLERSALILTAQAQNIADLANYFLSRSAADLGSLGRQMNLGPDSNTESVANRLEEYHRQVPRWDMLIAADLSGSVIATTRLLGAEAKVIPNPLESIADRTYFQGPLQNQKVHFSDLISDPKLDTQAVTTVSVPLSDGEGKPWGVLIGVFQASSFSRLERSLAEQSVMHSVILDRAGQTIFATENAGFDTSETLPGSNLYRRAASTEGAIFNFEHGDDSERRRYMSTHYDLNNGWQIFLFRSLEEIEGALLDEYAVALAWLIATLIIAICLALALVKSVSGPLEALDQSVRNFQLDVSQKRPSPPPNAPREVMAIFEHLGSLEKRLRVTYRKLHKSVKQGEKLRSELIHVIANREKEIEQRTDELQEANETLQRLSREDSLTGLANRRWFAEFLARTWKGAMRLEQAICILIIDIDDFKAFNDNYGHQKGDSCLKIVSEAIRRTVGRASDLVSRYGGEEFVVVLGDTSLDGGLKIAEDIRLAVETLGVPHKGSKNHRCVTVSIGVTSTLPAADAQPETVLVAADRAMYIAKHNGKNQIAYSTAAGTGVYQALCLPNTAETRLS